MRVRYAPSPTGQPHIGNVRTALFNWLFARRHGGAFIVRVEDTDQERLVPGALEAILESLEWLGLHWDEGPRVGGPFGPYIQSERQKLGNYQRAAEQLIQGGHAYRCYCTREQMEQTRTQQREQKAQSRPPDPCRGLSAQRLGTHDHPGIVLDEVVAMWATLAAVPRQALWTGLAFFVFRVLDVWKPWPIREADHRIPGGLGIMLDDALAAAFAAVIVSSLWRLSAFLQ